VDRPGRLSGVVAHAECPDLYRCHGATSIATDVPGPVRAGLGLPRFEAVVATVHPLGRYNRGPMFKSMIRTFRGPSRDPRMAFISRPLPRYLTDEEVLAALDLALERDPDPRYLVESLRPALQEVTGHDYEVLDRSVRDVTGAFSKPMVMIRDGSVGLWPGYAARAYPLLADQQRAEDARQAIAAAAGEEDREPSPTSPVGKPGWAPPAPGRPASPEAPVPVGTADAGASEVQDATAGEGD
jgi:hypothetical protein